MYHYIQDKEFLKRLKSTCSDVVNQLVQSINSDSVMTVKAHFVGSGAQNLITQNGKEPIDLDYNLCIVNTESVKTNVATLREQPIVIKRCYAPQDSLLINSGREIKEYIRKEFNQVLRRNGWNDCQDSTSALTTEKRFFNQGNKTKFSIDIAIAFQNNFGWHKLIHEKTGFIDSDRYYWNEIPDSAQLEEKVYTLKTNHLWNEVRNTYLAKKNFYLQRNDITHPSFVIYIEAVNQVYSKYTRELL